MKRKNRWSTQQHKTFARELRRDWRGLWEHVGEDVRQALIRAKAATVALMQDERTTMNCDDIAELINEIENHANSN